jgi:hypothetical protein
MGYTSVVLFLLLALGSLGCENNAPEKVQEALMYNVWLFYPGNIREEVDDILREFSGWYGSGYNLVDHERDHSYKNVSIGQLGKMLAALPVDGRATVRHEPLVQPAHDEQRSEGEADEE